MADPFTLGAIGALALTEGIKFLYTQAGALIDSWRKRREEKAADAEHPAPEAKSGELAPLEQSSDLDGTVDTAQPADAEMVAAKISELEQAFYALAPYCGPAPKPIDPGEKALLEQAGRLRDLLEAIYGQRLTFKGESREPTGTQLTANVRAQQLRNTQIDAITNAPATGDTRAAVEIDVSDATDSRITGISFEK